jgi:succinate-acetate transporter protein
MLVPAAGAAAGKLIPAVVLTTTAIRFAATGGYEWTAADGWRIASGVVGLVLCVLALYTAMAMLLKDVEHRTALPLLRRDAGSSSIAGGLADQVRRVESEAGVREQL